MKSNIMLESELVNLDEEGVIKYIGALYENIKRLAEAEKNDADIVDMKKALDDLKYERYGYEKKINTVKLKSARDHAKARGIVFKLPEIPNAD